MLTSRSAVRASLGASCQYTRTSSCANDLQLCSSICHIKATRHNRRLAHFQPLRVPCLPARPCPFTTPCLYNACARLDSSATAVIAQLAARRSHNPKVVSSILTHRICSSKNLRHQCCCLYCHHSPASKVCMAPALPTPPTACMAACITMTRTNSP